ncbi:hypothetical protein LLG95_10585, partial [bacterium]|nr:hypothetical protein [bacterium]
SDSPRHPYLPHRELSPADHPHPYDPRCIALNIHPRTGDTTKIPNKHPFFNRAHYGDFMKNAIMPWHRKKIPKRFG